MNEDGVVAVPRGPLDPALHINDEGVVADDEAAPWECGCFNNWLGGKVKAA